MSCCGLSGVQSGGEAALTLKPAEDEAMKDGGAAVGMKD